MIKKTYHCEFVVCLQRENVRKLKIFLSTSRNVFKLWKKRRKNWNNTRNGTKWEGEKNPQNMLGIFSVSSRLCRSCINLKPLKCASCFPHALKQCTSDQSGPKIFKYERDVHYLLRYHCIGRNLNLNLAIALSVWQIFQSFR